ncbi:hypothetical protein [Hominifimenecus sp. rT4P-3]|uniref:hypothetical protein n=1 Tax=Hominifimenecus sp. rT4P-3 TaxID=3242979 RepID=UPI003DA2BFAD
MKKAAALVLVGAMIFTLFGCGSKQEQTEESKGSQYASALDVLSAVVDAYAEEDLFAMYGGNQENAVMDAPGKFDISKTEELDITLGLPEDLAPDIDDAASMVHMMNANTFTGAVYHLKAGIDKNAFTDAVKSHILERQWICGQPDTLLILDVDGEYVVTAYGEAEIMKTFQANALSALSSATVIAEVPIG